MIECVSSKCKSISIDAAMPQTFGTPGMSQS